MTKRISWIDWAKVICIYLMVACHAGQKGLLLNMTYQFHMPAFFIISGMLYRYRGMAKELKLFLVPILFFGIVNLCYKFTVELYHSGFRLTEFLRGTANLFCYSLQSLVMESPVSWFQGYWFIAVLLFMRLFLGVHRIYTHRVGIALCCVCVCLAEPFLHLPHWLMGLKPYHVISCLPFFIAGVLVREKNVNVTGGSFEMKFMVAVLFFVLTLVQGRVDLLEYNYGLSYLLFLANALGGSWLLFNLCAFLPRRPYVETLSTGTLLILGLHGIIYVSVNSLLYRITEGGGYYLPLVSAAIVLLLCYPLILWTEKHTPLLLGKGKRMSRIEKTK